MARSSRRGPLAGLGGASVASQLLSLPGEVVLAFVVGAAPPSYARPRGDWRLLLEQGDGAVFCGLLGEALGTQLVCAPWGAVVDMVEPMVGLGFFRFNGFQGRRRLLSRARGSRTLSTRLWRPSALYARRVHRVRCPAALRGVWSRDRGVGAGWYASKAPSCPSARRFLQRQGLCVITVDH